MAIDEIIKAADEGVNRLDYVKITAKSDRLNPLAPSVGNTEEIGTEALESNRRLPDPNEVERVVRAFEADVEQVDEVRVEDNQMIDVIGSTGRKARVDMFRGRSSRPGRPIGPPGFDETLDESPEDAPLLNRLLNDFF